MSVTDTVGTLRRDDESGVPIGRVGRVVDALTPTIAELLDAAFTLVLTVTALAVLRTTFTGVEFLVVGGVGALLGIVVAHLCTALRLPWILVPIPLAATYVLFGGVAALRGDPAGGALPDGGTVAELWRLIIHGWRQLLTTLPPVDGSGALLALPFALGVAGGGLTLTSASRTRVSGAPLALVALVLTAAISLGTSRPGSLLLIGLLVGLGALCWASVRARRRIVQTGTGRRSQLVSAALILGVAVAAVGLGSSALPGTGTTHRSVARAHVTPPLDLSAFPAPLVGFRKYRPTTAGTLAGTTLFTVRGLPAGAPIRIATLDDYDGQVWAVRNDPSAPAVGNALDTFQRVGARVGESVQGRSVTLRVTIGAAYAAASDTSAWLPDSGYLTSLRFTGRNAESHDDAVRYNLATGTAVVPDRLRSGDTYSVTAVLPAASTFQAPPAATSAASSPTLDSGEYSFVAPFVLQLLGSGTSGAWEQLQKVATAFRAGAYSDGGPGEGAFLPGHSVGRLTTFFKADQLVGDDEQYAAAYALVANDLGIPARVVVGAVPGSDGRVTGADVHAWVELNLQGRGWTAIPRAAYTPPETNKPDKQNIEQQANSDSSIVPPPNAVRPPSSLDALAQSGSNTSRRSAKDAPPSRSIGLPGWVKGLLVYGLPPIGFVLLLAVLILGAKAWRRRRRRRVGTPALQVVAGWSEILDQARDLGVPVDVRLTRREQAAQLETHGVPPTADRADRVDRAVFGSSLPQEDESTDFWVDVRRLRRDMLLGVSRWRRLRARLSLRSLRPARTRMPATG